MGLGLYAVGALAFFPAKLTGNYYPFLLAYFVMTCGLSFLETSCNPYILSMGTEETATRRQLHPMDTAERAQLSQAEFEAIRDSDLTILITPYLTIGIVILVMLLVIRMSKMPKNADKSHSIDFIPTLKRLYAVKRYRYGVVARMP